MARLRQLFPQRYNSRQVIHDEFENVVRYLNSAELGNQSIRELLDKLYDRDGNVDGPFEIRYDQEEGLQIRFGEFADSGLGWETVASYDQLRGPAGTDIGRVDVPLLRDRLDEITLDPAGQSVFAYPHAVSDQVLAFRNGLLLGNPADFSTNAVAGTVTLTTPLLPMSNLTLLKASGDGSNGWTRIVHEVGKLTGESSFSIGALESALEVFVFENGILQIEGPAADYTLDMVNKVVTFVSPVPNGHVVTLMGMRDSGEYARLGILTEAQYTNPGTGLLRFDKLELPVDSITPDRVVGLAPSMASVPDTVVQTATPDAALTRFWVDLTQTLPRLRFSDNVNWHNTVPDQSLPEIGDNDGEKVVFVNAASNTYTLKSLDFSSALAVTARGAQNGVASLDSDTRLPVAELPLELNRNNVSLHIEGNVTAGDHILQYVFGMQFKITHLFVLLESGEADVQLAINGTGVDQVHKVIAGTPVRLGESDLVTVQQDASAVEKSIDLKVTPVTAPTGLFVTVGLRVSSL